MTFFTKTRDKILNISSQCLYLLLYLPFVLNWSLHIISSGDYRFGIFSGFEVQSLWTLTIVVLLCVNLIKKNKISKFVTGFARFLLFLLFLIIPMINLFGAFALNLHPMSKCADFPVYESKSGISQSYTYLPKVGILLYQRVPSTEVSLDKGDQIFDTSGYPKDIAESFRKCHIPFGGDNYYLD